MPRFNRIHALCQIIRGHGECEGCPAWDLSPYGKGKRSCRFKAEEAYNVARYGNPWGPDKSPRSWGVRRYRKDVTVRRAPKLRLVEHPS